MRLFAVALFVFYSFISTVNAQKFSVSFPDSLLKQPFTGHIVLYLSKDQKEPKEGTAGLDIFPCFRVYVKNIRPGMAVIIDDKAISFPAPLTDIERAVYYVQAVWDLKPGGGRAIAGTPGNLYSATQKVSLTKDFNKVYSLKATRVVADPSFKETQYVKEIKVPSTLLSNFHHSAVSVDAAVHLPKEYFTEPQRKFPVRFFVSGFGGDYHRYSGNENPMKPMDTTACIGVYLDGSCPLGHSVYANSENNGPWGDALTTEFIPQLEKTYRCNGAKLLNGHSSGGWTVLWLQTHYPEVFDGCWSSAPDPVDFRNFQQVNLYTHQNMFYGKDSTLNPTGTIAGFFPWFYMRDIYRMEHVIYRGEQMNSFDAVFSAKGVDGVPQSICNNRTGEIDSTVLEHWKIYDISLYLKDNWSRLKPLLDGKVRVTVGNHDNFLLNHAVKLLDARMKELNSSFVFGYYPGDHFTVSTPEYTKEGYLFLERKYLEWVDKNKQGSK